MLFIQFYFICTRIYLTTIAFFLVMGVVRFAYFTLFYDFRKDNVMNASMDMYVAWKHDLFLESNQSAMNKLSTTLKYWCLCDGCA
jgi:hypothetical protein